MKSYLRYYATEKLYHVSAEYSSGLGLDSRFPTLEKTAKNLLKMMQEENHQLPLKMQNGPTKHDKEQLNYLNQHPRPLTKEEEKNFLKLLGV